MIDRLIDVAIQCFDWFVPITVVDAYQRGVMLRFGKFHRVIEPGFHWQCPFGIDHAITHNVVSRTINLKAQSLTTKDSRPVVIGAVVTAKIRDIRKALLEVETVDNVLEDSCYGQVARIVAASTWDEVRHEEFNDKLTAACRANAFKFGVEITGVQLSDISPSRAIRLYQASA